MADFDYDAWSAKILAVRNRSAVLAWKAAELASLVPRRVLFASALEIGCAEGYVIHGLKERFGIGACYGTDVSAEFLARARELFPDISFLQAGPGPLPFADSSLDLVVASDLLEHVAGLPAFLAEVRRVAKFTLVKVPIEKYWWRTLVSKPLGRAGRVGPGHPDGHLSECTRRGWLSLFRRAGFSVRAARVIYYAPTDPPPHTRGSLRLRWWLDGLLKKRFPRQAHLVFGGSLIAFLDNACPGGYFFPTSRQKASPEKLRM